MLLMICENCVEDLSDHSIVATIQDSMTEKEL